MLQIDSKAFQNRYTIYPSRDKGITINAICQVILGEGWIESCNKMKNFNDEDDPASSLQFFRAQVILASL